jgi:hypothetical protein
LRENYKEILNILYGHLGPGILFFSAGEKKLSGAWTIMDAGAPEMFTLKNAERQLVRLERYVLNNAFFIIG